MEPEWFKTWFNTHYYHLLYSNRDEQEAQKFISALLAFLCFETNIRVLDVACGKGRHAVELNEKGFDVVGIDLSENSINDAKLFENNRLKFFVRDIRQPFDCGSFDLALNLFTSFGYFETKIEHIASLQHIYQCLKPQGLFVFDYLNPDFVEANFKSSYEIIIEGVCFEINKKLEKNQIIKQIEVNDRGVKTTFQERVWAFTFDEIATMITSVGFSIESSHGNYQLQPFSIDEPRIIIIAKKN